MKINHIKDNLINETNVNVITTDDNENDYIYIKELLTVHNSSIIGKDLDTNKEIKVKDKDIIYFETYGRDVCFTTIENKLLIIKISMKRLEEILSRRNYFIKVNKNTIINVKHIEEISYHSNMRFQVILSNRYKQVVNRSYFRDFKKSIEEEYNQ
ncbi:LytTR family DNA-binding domain-containing protein [Paraclostridium sp. AKS73]|uniref:LytTR family DNA-binding domain-containing protein n=2 Tax=Paraclostridium TaxID=1849822 RepID=UPI0021E062A7|nr:LytTR family DNA-binding domain-containing protein [Paraclostridium sp. AKS73]MCU9814637.1 LytTR family transcriptional regulator [Paraclostridium sp. AKS73]